MTKAVVDVGSNSVLLLVERQVDGRWEVLDETSEVTGLGHRTKATGLLSETGMADTLAALKRAFDRARSHGAESVTAAATMAARIATNTSDLLARAEAQGTPLGVLSGDEEAALGFEAVAYDPIFADQPRISIIDPGGNSTELVTADRTAAGWDVRFRRSYPLGTLGLTDTSLPNDVPSFAERLAAVREIDETIGLEYLPRQGGRAVVLGATGTNLVSIRERMTRWDPDRVHGAVLDFEEVGRAVGWLCSMPAEERARVPGMEPGRERTIHIGALILERFMQALHVLDCTVSVRGWRHALLERR